MQRPRSPSIADAAVARGNTHLLMRHGAPLAPSASVMDFGDLVARALAILAEETEAWQARAASNLPRGGVL
jgi:hypothetical protein